MRYASSYVRGLCEALQALGHDVDAFLAHIHVDPQQLYANNQWLALEDIDAIVREAVAMTGNAAFGLHWGEHSPMMQFDLGPTLMASAPSLRDALDAIVQVQFVFVSRAQLFFHEEGSLSTVALDLFPMSELSMRVMTELSLVCLLRCFRFLGHSRAVRRVHIGYPLPAHGAEYRRVFGAKLRVDKPRTSIEFVSSALDRRATPRKRWP